LSNNQAKPKTQFFYNFNNDFMALQMGGNVGLRHNLDSVKGLDKKTPVEPSTKGLHGGAWHRDR